MNHADLHALRLRSAAQRARLAQHWQRLAGHTSPGMKALALIEWLWRKRRWTPLLGLAMWALRRRRWPAAVVGSWLFTKWWRRLTRG